MPNVTVVYGTAGTGKTSWLIDQLATDAEMGVRSVFYTFSTSAADEIKERLDNRGIELNKFLRSISGTIHSLALTSTIGVPQYSIDQVPYYFLRKYHIPYSHSPFDTAKKGDIFLTMTTYAIHRAKSTEPTDIERHLYAYRARFGGLNVDEVMGLYKRYLEFKANKGFVDFNDVLVRYFYSESGVSAEKVYVDEAQDLSPLLFSIIMDKIEADEYYFIGDPLQNIYEDLLGSDPNLFLDQADHEILLTNGYRVPERVFSYVLKESRPPSYLQALYSSVSQPSGGTVKVVLMLKIEYLARIIRIYAENGKKVAVLVPKNRQVVALSKALLRYGIFSQGFKARSPVGFVSVIIDVFEEIEEEGRLSETTEEKLKKTFSKFDDLRNLLSVLTSPLFGPSYKRAYFSEWLTRHKIVPYGFKVSPNFVANVYVDTIHSAKGREADVIILLDPRTDLIRRYPTSATMAVANRLFFVGGTRARDALYLAKTIEGVKA